MGRREWSKRGNEQDKRGSRHGGVGGGGEGGGRGAPVNIHLLET